ncbi:MAG: ATP-dependent Lon protease [Candidatus Dependentiae bacterium]|nr:ATP-dependent Lon protease [Candidatus Dependentiae bacterium]
MRKQVSLIFCAIACLIFTQSVFAIPVVFVDGLLLPSTTRLFSPTEQKIQRQMISYHSAQEPVAFLLKMDDDATTAWGVTATVTQYVPEDGVKKTDPTFTITSKDIIQIYNPRDAIKETPLPNSPTKETRLEVSPSSCGIYKDAPLFNRLSPKTVEDIYEMLGRRYKTKALHKELLGITSCNQFIQTMVDRLNLEITPARALEFLTQNSTIQNKLKLLVESIFQQNRAANINSDDSNDLPTQFREQLEALQLPELTANFLFDMIDRYERSKQNQLEGPGLETYLRFALALPWADAASTEPEMFDLDTVAEALNEYQYGMDQVKDIVLTHLALRMVCPGGTPLVLCLVGAPGTGKTSICTHIAQALNKKMYRISLAGVHAQSDITGVSRSYLNASEGKILRGLKTMQSASGVVLLDEIDKMGNENKWHGSPADALLHALDPEQNTAFFDDYLSIPFNISKILFIATANNEREIPSALRDRMTIVQVPSYTRAEKIEIAQTKIIPRLLKKIGLMSQKPSFSNEVIGTIIDKYTFEDGLRGLTNQLNFLIGKFARGYLRNETITFTPDNLISFLGLAHNNLAQFKRKAKEIEPYLSPLARKKLFEAIDAFDVARERTDTHEQLRAYIAAFLAIPWAPEVDTTNYDLVTVAQAIEKTHYGADEVEESILDYLTLAQRNTDKSAGTVLCLYGPPGVGKTSIAQALATALNKKLIRVSMGSITSSLDIRGIASEYRNSHAGVIAQALIDSGSKNTLIVLDEIDKIPHISIANTLLDVLDPSQNTAFVDDYLGVPIDLSNVLFVATANDFQNIPYPLYDRLTIIEMPGYSERQKVEIAQNYLLPKLYAQNGITDLSFITPELLHAVVFNYTKETGVRQLNKRLKTIVARYLRNQNNNITPENLETVLGEPILHDAISRADTVGTCNGLYWSMGGGGVLLIQVTMAKGKGEIKISGLAKEDMQESARAALSYVKTNFANIMATYAPKVSLQNTTSLDKLDINIHVMRGAIPKSGPSAGLAFGTALISALTGRPTRHDYAMTGEIDLFGNAFAIGGLDQKLEGARSLGIKHVLVPEENRASIEALKEMPAGIDITFVQTIDDVLTQILLPATVDTSSLFTAVA